ncbi:MAG: hypothetical protein NUV51_04400 [Sulfuricaulis sp.]|nr:hypothetical protein [Sulfuricaulis sp.]
MSTVQIVGLVVCLGLIIKGIEVQYRQRTSGKQEGQHGADFIFVLCVLGGFVGAVLLLQHEISRL